MKTNGSEPTGWTGCSFCWRSSDVCFFFSVIFEEEEGLPIGKLREVDLIYPVKPPEVCYDWTLETYR